MATQQVYGVSDTMAALRDVDRQTYLAARKAMRAAMEPIRSDAAARLPADPPLSGMARGRLAWTTQGRRIQSKIGGRRPRAKETWPLARVVAAGAAASLYDMAGRATPSAPLAMNLSRSSAPRPSRAMWPAAEAHLPAVAAAVRASVDEMAAGISRSLAWKG